MAIGLACEGEQRADAAIVFAADGNYLRYAAFAAAQILALAPERRFDICLSMPADAAPVAGLGGLGVRLARVDTGGAFARLGQDPRRTEAAYLRLPEEADAFRIGDAAGASMAERFRALNNVRLAELAEKVVAGELKPLEDLLAAAAAVVRGTPRGPAPTTVRPRVPLVAVTGTNGKTTTSRMIAHIARQAIPREMGPDDMVGPCLFLASDASAMLTAQTLIVDGGLL